MARIFIVVMSIACTAVVATIQGLQGAPGFGIYRPNLYLGLRSKQPTGVSVGLMWGQDNTTSDQTKLRHTCEQNDGLAGWGWLSYDPRTGGTQVLPDESLGWNLTNTFFTNKDGQDFDLDISATPMRERSQPLKLIVYMSIMSDESLQDNLISCNTILSSVATTGPILCRTRWSDSSNKHFSFSSTAAKGESLLTDLYSANVTQDRMWKADEIYRQQRMIVNGLDAPLQPRLANVGNIIFFEVLIHNDSLLTLSSGKTQASTADTIRSVSRGDDVRKANTKLYNEVFPLHHPFRDPDHLAFGQAMLSNLLGGLGYFHGDVKVNRTSESGTWGVHTEGPYELLTAVPSRPFFPRGFLWDEGFHQLLIFDWDADLTLEVIRSWYRLMDGDGWIAREQILGEEARSKVPREFQTQNPEFANPPTLFLVLQELVNMLNGTRDYRGHPSSTLSNRTETKRYLSDIYPLLKRQYQWFQRTQHGDSPHAGTIGYRWRGRTDQHTLTSGLDDYPRAVPASSRELHVDLLCWVAVMSRTLAQIAALLGLKDDMKDFEDHFQQVVRSVDSLHWSKESQAYCDIVVQDGGTQSFICEKGYISLFPFITGLLAPDHPHLGPILDLIDSREALRSPYGVRSLSPSSKYYGKDENYWRGPIWININYMILAQLLTLAQVIGPCQHQARRIYVSLRKDVVQTVFESWRETGFAWEQYNQETGAGQRTQHFTGWTALVVNIMSMPDLVMGSQQPEGTDEFIKMNIRPPVPLTRGIWQTQLFIIAVASFVLLVIFRRRVYRVML